MDSPVELVDQLWKAFRETGGVYEAMLKVYGSKMTYANYPQLLDIYHVHRNGLAFPTYRKPFIAMTSADVYKYDVYELPTTANPDRMGFQVGEAETEENGLLRMSMWSTTEGQRLISKTVGDVPPMKKKEDST